MEQRFNSQRIQRPSLLRQRQQQRRQQLRKLATEPAQQAWKDLWELQRRTMALKKKRKGSWASQV